VTQRVGVLSGTPAHDRFGIWQFVRVNVDHRTIRGCQFRKMFVRLGIHFFNERQPFAARLSQSDHLFKPSGARRFDVEVSRALCSRYLTTQEQSDEHLLRRFTDALEANEEIVGRNVTENLFDRHWRPIFGRNGSGESPLFSRLHHTQKQV
jgi:hypothetical protein